MREPPVNLNANPTKEQLRGLLARADDRAGHHALWVDKTGDVHLSRLAANAAPTAFEEAHPDVQLRYETFEKGNEYVGPAAAGDAEWISQLFDSLLQEWSKARGKNEVEYVELG
ncbi:MAG TPA: hypothetical protein VJ739_15200 [Gemmataceae bacterium]|nr:hypothetical protein [Gemmataceae bacterium]